MRTTFVRSVGADDLMELFLVAAVVTVLLIRAFLYVADYPAFGESVGLHFAHVLWGGLLMFVSIAGFAAFLDRTARRVAVIAGGIGFGAFIDELGKFVTQNNDYFFEPTIAILYIVFIMVFFLIQILGREELRPEEYAANAFELAKEAALHRMDVAERDEALALIRRSHSTDPAVHALKNVLETMHPPERRLTWLDRLRAAALAGYGYLVRNRFYETALIALFVANAALHLVAIPKVVQGAGGALIWLAALVVLLIRIADGRRSGKKRGTFISALIAVVFTGMLIRSVMSVALPDLTPNEWGEVVFKALGALFVIAGVLRLRRSRRDAYIWFKRAVLVSVFLTQFFLFYRLQLFALPNLVFDLFVLAFLGYAIRAEANIETRAQDVRA